LWRVPHQESVSQKRNDQNGRADSKNDQEPASVYFLSNKDTDSGNDEEHCAQGTKENHKEPAQQLP
jgi:hypothetical protein